jgi:hypothetical protein
LTKKGKRGLTVLPLNSFFRAFRFIQPKPLPAISSARVKDTLYALSIAFIEWNEISDFTCITQFLTGYVFSNAVDTATAYIERGGMNHHCFSIGEYSFKNFLLVHPFYGWSRSSHHFNIFVPIRLRLQSENYNNLMPAAF